MHRFHPAFDFKRGDRRICKRFDKIKQCKVFAIEYVLSALVFENRKILARPFLFDQMIFPSAGMGTLASVGFSACKIIAYCAPA